MDLSLENGIWPMRKTSCVSESIDHRPLQGRCPKNWAMFSQQCFLSISWRSSTITLNNYRMYNMDINVTSLCPVLFCKGICLKLYEWNMKIGKKNIFFCLKSQIESLILCITPHLNSRWNLAYQYFSVLPTTYCAIDLKSCDRVHKQKT